MLVDEFFRLSLLSLLLFFPTFLWMHAKRAWRLDGACLLACLFFLAPHCKHIYRAFLESERRHGFWY